MDQKECGRGRGAAVEGGRDGARLPDFAGARLGSGDRESKARGETAAKERARLKASRCVGIRTGP